MLALFITGMPFGSWHSWHCQPDLGIVSHVIVLFDFQSRNARKSRAPERALVNAGIVPSGRFDTVGATVLASFRLHCTVDLVETPLLFADLRACRATFITLLLVPVFYSILFLI